MKVKDFLESFESIPTFPGIKANSTVYAWWDSQGSVHGIRALGFRCGCPNNEADELGLHKDGRSRRGTPNGSRPIADCNSKTRGIKALHKKHKRLSVRF